MISTGFVITRSTADAVIPLYPVNNAPAYLSIAGYNMAAGFYWASVGHLP